ncbi:hypothetical protein H9P43_000115 [Blastocladiella emersonii ATCC 22665]|nr:hypothetical protein H9P43_000115 [Blastocladiella emersonii ATCC 22665]
MYPSHFLAVAAGMSYPQQSPMQQQHHLQHAHAHAQAQAHAHAHSHQMHFQQSQMFHHHQQQQHLQHALLSQFPYMSDAPTHYVPTELVEPLEPVRRRRFVKRWRDGCHAGKAAAPVEFLVQPPTNLPASQTFGVGALPKSKGKAGKAATSPTSTKPLSASLSAAAAPFIPSFSKPVAIAAPVSAPVPPPAAAAAPPAAAALPTSPVAAKPIPAPAPKPASLPPKPAVPADAKPAAAPVAPAAAVKSSPAPTEPPNKRAPAHSAAPSTPATPATPTTPMSSASPSAPASKAKAPKAPSAWGAVPPPPPPPSSLSAPAPASTASAPPKTIVPSPVPTPASRKAAAAAAAISAEQPRGRDAPPAQPTATKPSANNSRAASKPERANGKHAPVAEPASTATSTTKPRSRSRGKNAEPAAPSAPVPPVPAVPKTAPAVSSWAAVASNPVKESPAKETAAPAPKPVEVKDEFPTPQSFTGKPAAAPVWAALAAAVPAATKSSSASSKPASPATKSATVPASKSESPGKPVAAPKTELAAKPAAPAGTSKSETTKTEPVDAPAAGEAASTPSADAAGPAPAPASAAAPKTAMSWASLVRPTTAAEPAKPAPATVSGLPKAGFVSLAELAKSYTDEFAGTTIPPRGLINNGNMCFLNVILQPLLHSPPFRNLLRTINTRVARSMRDNNRLVEAFVDFFKEYTDEDAKKIVAAAAAAASEAAATNGRGRSRERAGTPSTAVTAAVPETKSSSLLPEPIYDVVRAQRKMALVKGRQEDAEEFLGFLLDGLHLEFVAAMKAAAEAEEAAALAAKQRSGSTSSLNGNGNGASGDDGEWLEVSHGHGKHRTAVTRSVQATESPITRLFSGRIRSTLCVPGQKDSVTIEPFQSLQLDITPEDVSSVQEALRTLIKPEIITEYPAAGGRIVPEVTKQAQLERVPPVLVLHLKRFLYDHNTHDTVKLTKHVDVPAYLDLEPQLWAQRVRHAAAAASTRSRSSSPTRAGFTPRSALTPISPTRTTHGGAAAAAGAHPLPGPHSKFRLFAVVYHHGRTAGGGHYTCDVLESEQDGTWVRMDDTDLARVSTADVLNAKNDREPYLLFYECADLIERHPLVASNGRRIALKPAPAARPASRPAGETRAASPAAAPATVPAPVAAAAEPKPAGPVTIQGNAQAVEDEQTDLARAIAASLDDAPAAPPQPPASPPARDAAQEAIPFTEVKKPGKKPQQKGGNRKGGNPRGPR